MGNKLCHTYGNKIPEMINKIVDKEYRSFVDEKDGDIDDLLEYLENNFNKLRKVGQFIN